MAASHRHLLWGRGCRELLLRLLLLVSLAFALSLLALGEARGRGRLVELAGLVVAPGALARRERAALVVAQPLGRCASRSNHVC